MSPAPDTAPGYDSLFRGSARLGVLLGALKLPWSQTAPMIRAFASDLSDYHELSVENRAPVLGLMTSGHSKAFAFRVARYMEDHGVPEPELRRFLVRARYFEHRHLFFKVEFAPSGPYEFSYYVRRRVGLDVARAWLADCHVDDHGWASLEACARAIDKRTVHFLAGSVRLDQPSIHKVYFSQPDDGQAWQRVQAATSRWGLEPEAWHALLPHRAPLANRPMFFSVGFQDGVPMPGVKLDFQSVDTSVVHAMLANETIARARFDLLRRSFNKQRYDYLGVQLRPDNQSDSQADRSIGLRAYCYEQRAPAQRK